jgi:regulator of sigma E protease
MALSLLQNIWWLLVLIGVMILIHELGHFWAARAFGVRVDVFSFGFGPRLFGFHRGETDYRFSLILFGGYVKMAGEQPLENLGSPGQPLAMAGPGIAREMIAGNAAPPASPTYNLNDPGLLNNKARWQRLIITAAGPFMNVVLAVVVLTGLYMVSYERIIDEGGARIGHVMPDSPAARAGIQAGDKIIRLDGKANPDWEDIVSKEIAGAERPMTVTIERAGHQFAVSVTPVLDEKDGVGSAGWEGQNQIQVGWIEEGRSAAPYQQYPHSLALYPARGDPEERWQRRNH